MIRLLLDPRQTLDDVAPDLPERVPVQPGDIVIERDDDSFLVFRFEPDAVEIGALVFSSFAAALAAARDAAGRLPTRVLPERLSRPTAEIIDLRPYIERRARRGRR